MVMSIDMTTILGPWAALTTITAACVCQPTPTQWHWNITTFASLLSVSLGLLKLWILMTSLSWASHAKQCKWSLIIYKAWLSLYHSSSDCNTAGWDRGVQTCFRTGVSGSLWDVEGPLGLCWQLAAILHPALNISDQRGPCHFHLGAELCITDDDSCHFRRPYNPCSCPKKGSAFQESFLTDVSNLFIKPFSDREANISLDNPFQYLSVLTTTKYLGFSPLNSWLLFSFLLPWARRQFLFSLSLLNSCRTLSDSFSSAKILLTEVLMRPFFHDLQV